MVKKAVKRKRALVETAVEENVVALPPKRKSDDLIPTKAKWTNKQRVLVFAARGISFRDRHLMEDLKKLMPHHKTEAKMERSKTLSVINEMCEIKHCNKAILFEGRKRKDLYLWFSNVSSGPSVKFLVENIYTMAELKLTGNCLRGSRPLLSFDPTFADKPHYLLLKELLTQIFGVPNHHPKSQPFFDHVYTFTVLDNRIWFRNFQILNDEGALAEVGPRFVLNPVKIFSGSFGGTALWENPFYLSPSRHRKQINLVAKNKYVNRQEQKLHAEATKPKESFQVTPLEDIFKGDAYERAQAIQKELEVQKAKEDKLKEKKEKLMERNRKLLERKSKKEEESVQNGDDSDELENDENDFDEASDVDNDDDDDIDEDEDIPEEEAKINIKNVMDTLKKMKSLDKPTKTTKIIKPMKKATKVVTKVKKKALKK
ncbi:ribosome biogenesis protein BRX1 homolog [Atheta coriaria]|uniref:ribosome biogenesis protein BRX1 homolog n=1 Tax=Dalotia coriaria TaxID=877792 RepID=UPI0031F3CBCB